MEFESSLERRRVGAGDSRAGAHRNRDERLEESVRLRLDGDVIDPLFLSWEANLSLGLSQERFHERIGSVDQTDTETGLLREFDIALRFLPAKPVSVSAFARRIRDRIPRRFLPSLLEERTELGVTALLSLGGWDASVGWQGSDLDRSGNRAELDDESLETSRFFIDGRVNFAPHHRLSVSYDHQRDQSRYQGSVARFDTRRNTFRLDHDFAFGPQRQHQLGTVIRVNEEQGDLARDEFEFSPSLSLRHGDMLRSTYRYSHYEIEQGGLELTRDRVDAQAFYNPRPGLSVAGQLFGQHESFDGSAGAEQYGGGMDVSYRRPNAWGELAAHASWRADRERFTGRARGGLVRGETHTLEETRPTLLVEADIEPSSIIAFSTDRTRVFVRGSDYRIRTIGRRTAVFRRLSGRIAPGEVVLFDYRYRVATGARLDGRRIDLRLEQAFASGWTPYYVLGIRRQDAGSSDGPDVFADRTEHHRFGIRLNRPHGSLRGEFESFDDSVQPYDGMHVGGSARLLDAADHAVDLTANASWFDFKGEFDRRRVWLVDTGLQAQQRLGRYLHATLASTYRHERDSVDGTTDGVDVELGLRFRRGQLDVDLHVEYDLLAIDEHDEGVGVWLTVRRDLSHLLADGRERRQ